MKNLLFTYFLVLLFPIILDGQAKLIDSLQQKLTQVTENIDRWKIQKAIAEFYITNNPDSAKVYADRCLALAIKELPEQLSLSYVLLGAYYTEYQEYAEASDVLYKALELSEKEQCTNCRIEALNELFIISYDQLEFDKALRHLRETLFLAKTLKDSSMIVRAMTNLSMVFSQVPQADSARFYAYTAIEMANAIQELKFLRYCYNNLGVVHQYNGEYTEAVEQFKKSAEFAHLAADKDMLASSWYNVAGSSLLANKLDTGFHYLELFRTLVIELKKPDFLAYYYEGMSEGFERKRDYKKALEYFKKAATLRDSLQSKMYGANLAEADAKFKTSEKEAQLVAQELVIERQKSTQKNFLIGSVLSILLLLGIFQYFRSRQKMKAQHAEMALQLEQAEAEKLRELDRLKTTFFTNISHEFRTPLTLIKTPLQDLINGKLRGNVQKYYRIMNRNADRLMALVNQLLDLAKLESGKMHLVATIGDLSKLVRAIVYSFESLALQKEITLRVDVPSEPVIAWFDSEKMEKVLNNLISNAFKFTMEEGQVRVVVFQRDNKVGFSVEDSGMGIPKDQLNHIFDRFYQAKASSDLQAGSGIGLALTRELVVLHGGEIVAESVEGKGSVFSVLLPLSNAHLDHSFVKQHDQVEEGIRANYSEKIKDSTHSVPVSEELFQETKRISNPQQLLLIVEDNPDVRTYISEQIGETYKVLEAEDGTIGFELATQYLPDLIVTDVMMPKMSGTELCRQLKTNEKTSHIPIIMLTAKADRVDKLEGLQTGADDYLTKPFDAEELRIRIKNLIDQRRQLQAKFGQSSPFTPKDIAVNSVDEVFLNNVMSTIEENIDDEAFSIEQLAAAVAMSRSQLHRKIKALTAVSPSVFLRTVRLERAKQLLEKNAGNASEVAFMVGFNSSSYFAKCFKDHFGITPTGMLPG